MRHPAKRARAAVDPTEATSIVTEHSSAGHTRLLALLQRQEDFRPQLAGLTNGIRKVDTRHARIITASHGVQLRDNIVQSNRLTDRLGSRRVEVDVDNVDVEVVVCWLVCGHLLATSDNEREVDQTNSECKT